MALEYAEKSVENHEQNDLHVAVAYAARLGVAAEQRKEPVRIRNAVTEPHRAAEAVDLQQEAVEQRELPQTQRRNQHAALIQRFQKRFDRACRRARSLQGFHDRFPREAAIQRARRQQIQQREGD